MFHAIYLRFLSGPILCTVKGPRQYSSDLPQGGLEIPCTLEFVSHKENEAAKAERLLEPALGSKGKKVLKEIKENDLKLTLTGRKFFAVWQAVNCLEETPFLCVDFSGKTDLDEIIGYSERQFQGCSSELG